VELWQDLRYGCRMLAASPAFTIVAVLSLAIGIGANCAIFSFADALLLRPLPVARPGEVDTVGARSSTEAFNASSLMSSYRDYIDIRDRSKSFDGLAAYQYLSVAFASDPSATPKLKMGMMVSGNLLPLMGVEPTLGRAFRADEARCQAATRSSCSAGRCGNRNSGRTRVCWAAACRSTVCRSP
jgi:putative ABC transport system permease protein